MGGKGRTPLIWSLHVDGGSPHTHTQIVNSSLCRTISRTPSGGSRTLSYENPEWNLQRETRHSCGLRLLEHAYERHGGRQHHVLVACFEISCVGLCVGRLSRYHNNPVSQSDRSETAAPPPLSQMTPSLVKRVLSGQTHSKHSKHICHGRTMAHGFIRSVIQKYAQFWLHKMVGPSI